MSNELDVQNKWEENTHTHTHKQHTLGMVETRSVNEEQTDTHIHIDNNTVSSAGLLMMMQVLHIYLHSD